MSYSIFYIQIACLLVAVKGYSRQGDSCHAKVVCPNNSVRCLINETTEWLEDKKFVKMILDRMALKNVTNVYDLHFSDEGFPKLTYKKSKMLKRGWSPDSQSPDKSIRHFMDAEEIRKHQSLCYNENSTAFMLDDDAPAPYNATKITDVKMIKAVDLAKFLAVFRARIGCTFQETAQLRHVIDLEFCQDNGHGILTTLFIILCASILMIAMVVVLVVIAAKYKDIDQKEMSSNDEPSFDLPFSFSNLSLTSEENFSGREHQVDEYKADEFVVSLVNTPNSSSEDSEYATEDNSTTGQCSWVNVVPETNLLSWTHDREFRERNKSLRQIYEDEGLDYGKDVSAAALQSRMSNAVKLRQESVAKMFKILKESRDVQLCFLVDVTKSMRVHIDGIRNSIFKIVEKLTEKHVTFAGHSVIAKKVSLAFVGYRDFGYKNQFEILSFTENAEAFRQFCTEIKTPKRGSTNFDPPEDVFGGLEKAISDLSWSDSMSTKIIFHIADHPCHGRKYHTARYIDNYNDNYPDGDPNGRTAESLFESLREKGIQYHFGRIYWTTDKMIELFSEAMGNDIEVFNVKEIENLVNCIVSSVSIGTSMHPAMIAKQQILKILKTIPDWSKVPIFKGVFLSYELPESIVEVINGLPMTKKNPARAKIQIAEHPFAHGAERKTFYGRDLSGNLPTDIVLKEYIRQNTDAASRCAAVPYEIATQMQTIAAYLAYTFTDCLQTMAGIVYDIKFLKVQVLSIEIKPGENRYLSCERRYGNDSKFLRFSNNADYEMLECTCKANNLNFDIVELLMAFSHWTYQISGGYLMVVDLQGIKSTDENGRTILELTDPAIHCTDLTRFGRTNMGLEGMKIFFARHKCNKFCHGMELETATL